MRGNIINKHREYLANEVNLDQEFSLSLGQSIMIAGENLAIKFIEVISESSYRKVLTQPGLSGPSKTSFTNYEITFDLRPYPEVSKAPDKKGYHLRLVIGKKSFQTSLK